MLQTNKLKAKLKAGEACLGAFINFPWRGSRLPQDR
jgi:hypothetical protein